MPSTSPRRLSWLIAGAIVGLSSSLSRADTVDEALWQAIEHRDITEVENAIADGAEPDQSTRPFLRSAVARGEVDIVKRLLRAKARLDLADPTDGALLPAAVAAQDPTAAMELVKILLAAGILKTDPSQGPAALQAALTAGRLDIGQWIVGAGVVLDPNAPLTSQMWQIVLSRPAVAEQEIAPLVSLMLSAGADPHVRLAEFPAAVDLASDYGWIETLARFDPKNKGHRDLAAVRQRGLDRRLIAAVARHNSSRIRWAEPPPNQPPSQWAEINQLLRAGANPRSAQKMWGERAYTALGALLTLSTAPPFEADPKVLDLLLDHGAAWADLGPQRERRLHEVLQLPELAVIAIDHGLPATTPLPAVAVDAKGQPVTYRTTVLHEAAAGGSIEVMTRLLAHGASVDEIDEAGYTPLAYAVAGGHTALIDFLLARGASAGIVTRDGLTLADLAARSNNRRLIRQWDPAGRYREILDAYSPPANSPWSGAWLGGPVNAGSPIELAADGSGSGAALGGAFMWTEIDDGVRLRIRRTSRLGTVGIKEFDLIADGPDRLIRRSANPTADYGFRLWRPGTRSEPLAASSTTTSSPEVDVAVAEQFAALASGRSTTFELTLPKGFAALPERVWQETRWTQFMVQSPEIGLLPAALANLQNLQSLSIANQAALQIESGALRLPQLTRIDLRSTGLAALPLRWSEVPALTELSIYDSRLRSLPAGWADAKKLQSIFVANSRIRELPPDLGEAPILKSASLSGNLLTTLPQSLADSSIEHLYLADNRFVVIPAVVAAMPRLYALNLSSNRLTHVTAQQLPRYLHDLNLANNRLLEPPDFADFPQLERLNLSGNQLTEIPSDPAWLPASVLDLDLSRNQLKSLPAWLKARPFRRLDLGQNTWSEDEAKAVSRHASELWQESAKK